VDQECRARHGAEAAPGAAHRAKSGHPTVRVKGVDALRLAIHGNRARLAQVGTIHLHRRQIRRIQRHEARVAKSGLSGAIGNLYPPSSASTWCHACGGSLIKRAWHEILEGRLGPDCGTPWPGVFEEKPGNWGRKRQSVRLAP